MSFKFPILKRSIQHMILHLLIFAFRKEAVSHLQAHGINITEEQLRDPDAGVIRGLFERCIEVIRNASKDELRQPVFSAMSHLQPLELFEDSIADASMSKYLSVAGVLRLDSYDSSLEVVKQCGITDVTLRDLFDNRGEQNVHVAWLLTLLVPDPKRVLLLVSSLINFMHFCGNIRLLEEEMSSQLGSVQSQYDQLNQESTGWQNRLAQANERLGSDQLASEQMDRQIAQLAQQEQQLAQQLQAEQHKLSEQIRISDHMQQTVDRAQRELEANQQQLQHLRSQIVDSPEQVEARLGETWDRVRKQQHSVQQLQQQYSTLSQQHVQLEQVEQKMQRRVDLLIQHEKQQDDVQHRQKRVRQLETELDSRRRESELHQHQLSQIERQIFEAESRLAQVDQAYLTERSRRLDQLRDLESQLHEQRTRMSAQNRHQMQLQQSIDSKRAQLVSLDQEHQQLMAELDQRLERLTDRFRVFAQQIRAAPDSEDDEDMTGEVSRIVTSIPASARQTPAKWASAAKRRVTMSQMNTVNPSVKAVALPPQRGVPFSLFR